MSEGDGCTAGTIFLRRIRVSVTTAMEVSPDADRVEAVNELRVVADSCKASVTGRVVGFVGGACFGAEAESERLVLNSLDLSAARAPASDSAFAALAARVAAAAGAVASSAPRVAALAF